MSKSNRKKKVQPSTIDVQVARMQAIVWQNLENAEDELYQELRLNWELFEKYVTEQNQREAVLRYLYAKRYAEALHKVLSEYKDIPEDKIRVEALVKRAEQQRAQMNEYIEWPEDMKEVS